MIKTNYVVGFLYNNSLSHVVLIEKQKPQWQQGKLNGVGGHIEKDETSYEAMEREFKEEAGTTVKNWKLSVTLTSTTWRIFFFWATGSIRLVSTQTNEKIEIVSVRSLPSNIIPNLLWLIPLCCDSNIGKPINLCDNINSIF